jgi:hypothetical protein
MSRPRENRGKGKDARDSARDDSGVCGLAEPSIFAGHDPPDCGAAGISCPYEEPRYAGISGTAAIRACV